MAQLREWLAVAEPVWSRAARLLSSLSVVGFASFTLSVVFSAWPQALASYMFMASTAAAAAALILLEARRVAVGVVRRFGLDVSSPCLPDPSLAVLAALAPPAAAILAYVAASSLSCILGMLDEKRFYLPRRPRLGSLLPYSLLMIGMPALYSLVAAYIESASYLASSHASSIR